MGLFYSSPSKPNFSRIGRGRPPSLCGPLKNPGNTTLTWFLKLLNRISALPPNLAFGMKTHKACKKYIPFLFRLRAIMHFANDFPIRNRPRYGRHREYCG